MTVVKRDKVGDGTFDEIASALIESSLEVKGVVTPTDREHGYEVQVTEARVIGPVDPSETIPDHGVSDGGRWRRNRVSLGPQAPLPKDGQDDHHAEGQVLHLQGHPLLLPRMRLH